MGITKKTSETGKAPTVRRKRCEGCGNETDMKALFTVRDRDICLACGRRELAEWNQFVKDAEAQL